MQLSRSISILQAHLIPCCNMWIPATSRLSHVSLSHRSILQRLHAATPSPRLEASLLDKHTTKMCSVHKYPPCFFCATQPTSQPAPTLVICSRCGFLCHQLCLHDFMSNDDNSTTFQNLCPRCGRTSVKLTSHISSGYRNFASILQHRGYRCLNHPTNSLPRINHARRNNAIPGGTVGGFLVVFESQILDPGNVEK